MVKRYAVSVKPNAMGTRLNRQTQELEQFPITEAMSAGLTFTRAPVELEEGPVIGLLRSNELLEIEPITTRK